jgi:DNA-binding CsgD family transcriptional regulator
MIRQGRTNDEIAEQLYIAPSTVKTHRRNIRKKLGLAGAKNRLQAYFQTSKPNYQHLCG